MLSSQLRRTLLLTILVIAALTMMTKTVSPNLMHLKMTRYIAKTKKDLEKMRRTKCLTRYSYVDKTNKKESEKYIIKKNFKNDIKNSKKNLEKMKRTKCLTSFVIKNVEMDEPKAPRMFDLGLGVNRFSRMVNGNGRSSYNIALWNCRKGLLDTRH